MPKAETIEANEPQPLSREYHAARKQLMLWAAILFIWELVGIDLEKAKEAGGNIGTIITAIKSPQAVPWTLLILVVYFLFRFTVEWNQSSASRRLVRWAKIDYAVSWILSLAAFALYIGQTASQSQFADLLKESSRRWSLLLGIAVGCAINTVAVSLWRFGSLRRSRVLIMRFGLAAVCLVSIIASLEAVTTQHLWFVLIGFASGLILSTPITLGMEVVRMRLPTIEDSQEP